MSERSNGGFEDMVAQMALREKYQRHERIDQSRIADARRAVGAAIRELEASGKQDLAADLLKVTVILDWLRKLRARILVGLGAETSIQSDGDADWYS